jgi:hypothetical protein
LEYIWHNSFVRTTSLKIPLNLEKQTVQNFYDQKQKKEGKENNESEHLVLELTLASSTGGQLIKTMRVVSERL